MDKAGFIPKNMLITNMNENPKHVINNVVSRIRIFYFNMLEKNFKAIMGQVKI